LYADVSMIPKLSTPELVGKQGIPFMIAGKQLQTGTLYALDRIHSTTLTSICPINLFLSIFLIH
jgi:hypothetical protein